MTQVSVIIPIFNAQADYLEYCLASLCTQTLEDAEFICIDDGSEPYVADLCLATATCDKRFRYLRIEHAGVSTARNRGIEESKGDYITFMDADDWVEDCYLQELADAAERLDADIVVTNAMIERTLAQSVENNFVQGDERILSDEERHDLLRQLFSKRLCERYPAEVAPGAVWAKLYRKDFLAQSHIGFAPNMTRMEDALMFEHAIFAANRMGFAPGNRYHYRIYPESVCRAYDPKITEQFELFYKGSKTLLAAQGENELLRALQAKELTSFNAYALYWLFHEDNPDSFAQAAHKGSALLDREPYASALSEVDASLLTSSERLFVFLLKHRQFRAIRFLARARARQRGNM